MPYSGLNNGFLSPTDKRSLAFNDCLIDDLNCDNATRFNVKIVLKKTISKMGNRKLVSFLRL